MYHKEHLFSAKLSASSSIHRPQVDIALKISGGAVFVMNMMDEVDEATERVWQRLQDSGNPSAIFVSQVISCCL